MNETFLGHIIRCVASVYCDSTGLYTDEECFDDNLCDLYFPEWIVREWYKTNECDLVYITMRELHIPESEVTFEKWFYEASTAMDTDGLYDFALERGFKAERR